MSLSSTQIGSLAEALVANELMIESAGNLSPFTAIADDDGIDLLIYNKSNGVAVPIQVKARTKTLQGGNGVHFEVRKTTMRDDRGGLLLCVLLNQSLRTTRRAWIIPLRDLPTIAYDRGSKFVIRPSLSTESNDRYRSFQCVDMAEVAKRVEGYDPSDA